MGPCPGVLSTRTPEGSTPGVIRGWGLGEFEGLNKSFDSCSVFHHLGIAGSPHEPDPEPYEPVPPKLIPLDEVRECDVGIGARVTDVGAAFM